MNENYTDELRESILREGECRFSANGRDYLVYGWDQCDGYVLNLEADGELIWQTTAHQQRVCADRFVEYCKTGL